MESKESISDVGLFKIKPKDMLFEMTGGIIVLLPVNKPIPRIDEEGNEYMIMFSPDTIKQIKEAYTGDHKIWIATERSEGVLVGGLVTKGNYALSMSCDSGAFIVNESKTKQS